MCIYISKHCLSAKRNSSEANNHLDKFFKITSSIPYNKVETFGNAVILLFENLSTKFCSISA